VEDVTNSVLASVAKLIDAKFEGLEDRLLPKRNYRPPLAADKGAFVPRGSDPGTSQEGGKSSNRETPTKARLADPQVPTTSGAQVEGDSWTTVVKKKKRKPRKKAEAKAGATNPPPQNQKGKEKAKAKLKRGTASVPDPVKRIRPPCTAAVVLTLQPEAEEMGLNYAA
jgi:hypothetical protein